METKIQPIAKSKLIPYGEKQLQNFWQQKPPIPAKQNPKDKILEILQLVSEGIVCVQSELLTNKEIIKRIFDIAQNLKVRFYILANDYSPELYLLNDVCLIRYEVTNKGSFILTNPNSNNPKGLFFTGQLTEQSLAISQHLSKDLEAKETEELFRHFCYHFWETAKKEVIEKGKKNEITSKPLDIFHDTKTFGEKDFVYGTLFDFIEKTSRKELSNQSIIYLDRETEIPTEIKANTIVDLDDNFFQSLLPKSEFETQEPNFKDDGVSVNIEYKWQNIPFYLPEKASENSLYDKWKKKNDEIIKVLDGILQKIQDAEKRKYSLAEVFSRFFLGKKQRFNELKDEIDELKQTDFPNITESKLKEKIKRINEIHEQVQKEIGEIEIEDKSAKLDEEIDELNLKLKEKETALANIKIELEIKQKELDGKLKDFLAKNNLEEKNLAKHKNEWEQKARNKNPEEAEDAQIKLDELNELQNKVFYNKLKSSSENTEKEVNKNKNDIKTKEKEKEKLKAKQNAETKSSLEELNSSSSSKHNSTQKNYFEVPDLLQLPQIGKLFQVNSQSFLAIEFWEQYEQGKSEAERLKATLCAIKN